MKILVTVACLLSAITLAEAQQTEVKVAYVDTEYVVSQMPETKQMQQKVAETQTKLQNEYAALQKQFEQEYQAYAANANTMADTARQRTEQHLQQLNGQLQTFSQDAQKTLQNTRNYYMAPLYLKIGNAINAVASENNYTVILPSHLHEQRFLLYADKKLDISNQVITALGVTPQQGEQK